MIIFLIKIAILVLVGKWLFELLCLKLEGAYVTGRALRPWNATLVRRRGCAIVAHVDGEAVRKQGMRLGWAAVVLQGAKPRCCDSDVIIYAIRDATAVAVQVVPL